VSITPNTYVVGIDQSQDVILVHQLVPASHEKAADEVLGSL
jgi:hypothetical protein